MYNKQQPQIAIITSNTLTGIGLRSIIKRMMPGAETLLFSGVEELSKEDHGQFFHYFVSANSLLDHAAYFKDKQSKTIVLVHGEKDAHFAKQFHTFNVNLQEDMLVRSFLKVADKGHHATTNEAVARAKGISAAYKLTTREKEVLRGVVLGKKNKEIASELNVALATIISHRKNVTEKLSIKSVSGLTIFAVMHGIVRAEEI